MEYNIRRRDSYPFKTYYMVKVEDKNATRFQATFFVKRLYAVMFSFAYDKKLSIAL